jgi:hypothetical protein
MVFCLFHIHYKFVPQIHWTFVISGFSASNYSKKKTISASQVNFASWQCVPAQYFQCKDLLGKKLVSVQNSSIFVAWASLKTKTFLRDCHCTLFEWPQINVTTVLTEHSEIYFHQPADKIEMLECLYAVKRRVHSTEDIYIYALFTDQSGYSIVRPRTDDVPPERLLSYTSGEASLLK